MNLNASIVNWCRDELGAEPARQLFRRSHLSDVIGLELVDGRRVVLKIRAPSGRLEAATMVQRHLHDKGFPCPEVLGGPSPLGERSATAEEYVLAHGPPPLQPPPGPVAELLAELVRAAPLPEAAPALEAAPPWVGWDHCDGQLWPWPDDLDVDMNDHPGPDWVDDTAARIRDRMRNDSGQRVIGHIDWEANNLDWIGDAPVMVHDWDSLAIRTEAAVAGAAAAVYPCNGTTVLAASIEQTGTFLDAYRRARPDHWSSDSDEIAWCAGLWVLTYNAKKESLGGGTGYLDQVAREVTARRKAAGL